MNLLCVINIFKHTNAHIYQQKKFYFGLKDKFLDLSASVYVFKSLYRLCVLDQQEI